MRCLLVLLFTLGLGAAEALRIVHTRSYAPFEFVDEQGQPQGYLISCFQRWSELTGQPIEFRSLSWSECLRAIRQGEADVITGMTPTAQRRPHFAFGTELARAESRIFTHRSLPPVERAADLAGMLVGVVEGDQSDQALAGRVPAAERRAFSDYHSLVQAAVAGEIKIMVGTSAVIHHHLTGLAALGRFHISGHVINADPLAVAVAADRRDLLRRLDAGFARFTNQDWEQLARRWVPYTLEPQDELPWWEILIGLAVVVATLGLVVLWNRQLQHRVRAVTWELQQARDIAQLAHSELQGLLDAATGLAILATDVHGTITCFNAGAERLLGISAEQIIGQMRPDRFHQADDLAALRQRQQRSNEAPVDDFQLLLRSYLTPDLGSHDVTWVRADGEGIQIDLAISEVHNVDEKLIGYLLVGQDIGRQRQLEKQLQRSQKMDAVGQLAGGVAHDFNNILMVIIGFAEQLLLEAGLSESMREQLQTIVETADRAAALSKQMLAFSRQAKSQSIPTDVHDVLRETVAMLQRTIDPRIKLELHADADANTVMGDASLLQNAFINLGLNARDAMPDGGSLLINTETMNVDATMSLDTGGELPPGRYLTVQVRDTGAGMSASVVRQIFDPFFTTKELGKGTGLGLAAVYGIMRDHGGGIQVQSRLGQGTIFTCLLPLSELLIPDPKQRVSTVYGEGNILVIDDDETVRRMFIGMLRRFGYQTKEAADGPEGLELIRDGAQLFHLVLLDMMLPSMHGLDVLREIKAIRADLPVLVISGFSPDSTVEDVLAAGAAGFVPKPCRAGELSQRVSEIIDSC